VLLGTKDAREVVVMYRPVKVDYVGPTDPEGNIIPAKEPGLRPVQRAGLVPAVKTKDKVIQVAKLEKNGGFDRANQLEKLGIFDRDRDYVPWEKGSKKPHGYPPVEEGFLDQKSGQWVSKADSYELKPVGAQYLPAGRADREFSPAEIRKFKPAGSFEIRAVGQDSRN
jgi:hypothetical protein